MKIGFFDSGIGGLSILNAVSNQLPEYDYLYYGDTEHLPLGDKSEHKVYEYTKTGVKYLFEKDCQLVIIACNTASAEALRKLQDTMVFNNFPEHKILGVIIPTIETILETKLKHILLLATKRTIDSDKYKIELQKQSIVHAKLTTCSTPELVPLIERDNVERAVFTAKSIIDEALKKEKGIDGLILGCTHYTLLASPLRDIYGDKLTILSQDEIIPTKLAFYLEKHPEITTKLTRNSDLNIFLTEHNANYDKIITRLFNGNFIVT